MWLSPSHLAGWASGPASEIWLPKLAGWLGLRPSQPNVAAKILKWLETCFQRFHDSATLVTQCTLGKSLQGTSPQKYHKIAILMVFKTTYMLPYAADF